MLRNSGSGSRHSDFTFSKSMAGPRQLRKEICLELQGKEKANILTRHLSAHSGTQKICWLIFVHWTTLKPKLENNMRYDCHRGKGGKLEDKNGREAS